MKPVKTVTDIIPMTDAASENVRECGVDARKDIARVRNGLTADQLLSECLDGADEDQVGGWADYVDAVIEAAMTPEDVEALRIEAAAHGDIELAMLCQIAFDDGDARRKVMRALLDGGAQ